MAFRSPKLLAALAIAASVNGPLHAQTWPPRIATYPLADPRLTFHMATLHALAQTGAQQVNAFAETPEQFAAAPNVEQDNWGRLVRERNLSLE